MLRTIRIILALACFIPLTLLFLDFTGSLHGWFGFLPRLQLLPALLALNLGVVALLLLLTLLFGRIYCSVICPLGVMQDGISWLSARRRRARYRFGYRPARTWLRAGFLALFVASLLLGAGSLAALLAPYGTFGRIVSNLAAPLCGWVNNLLALLAEHAGSYAFHTTDVWIRSLPVFLLAAAGFLLIAFMAWRGGRTWCNTVCPVGTVLGFFSRFSLFRPVIDASRCNSCSLCARGCKSSCIDSDAHTIDYSRCVACMDCMETCRHGAIRFRARRAFSGGSDAGNPEPDPSRRAFLTGAALLAGSAVRARGKKIDGGLAVILDKQAPRRTTPVVPPGAQSLSNLASRCTGCQLCVSVCPNGVLRPSSGLLTFMQPESSFERGYCRPECTKCSEVCPSGAILRITPEEKSSVQVGHAVWIRRNCLPLTEGVSCGNCARHCPTGAITMVPSDASDPSSPRIPAIHTERCIGCGACEHLCPSRPFSAIMVEGHERHRII